MYTCTYMYMYMYRLVCSSLEGYYVSYRYQQKNKYGYHRNLLQYYYEQYWYRYQHYYWQYQYSTTRIKLIDYKYAGGVVVNKRCSAYWQLPAITSFTCTVYSSGNLVKFVFQQLFFVKYFKLLKTNILSYRVEFILFSNTF